jgi:hypothetical protein
MADELTYNASTGQTFYACRFQQNGDVFLTDGSSDEVWGTGGRDADDYDVQMTEEDSCGHYKAAFDASSNIGAGVYQVVIYKQGGANPVDADPPMAQGEIYWDGTAEVNIYTLRSDLNTVISDLTIVDSNLDTANSDIVVIDSNVDSVLSDLVVVDSNIDTIYSDLVVMDSNIDTSISDMAHLAVIGNLQYNDFQFPGGGGLGTSAEIAQFTGI